MRSTSGGLLRCLIGSVRSSLRFRPWRSPKTPGVHLWEGTDRATVGLTKRSRERRPDADHDGMSTPLSSPTPAMAPEPFPVTSPLTGIEYAVADAARLLGVHERTLRQWIHEAKVPARLPPTGRRGTFIEAAVLQQLKSAPPTWLRLHYTKEALAEGRLAPEFAPVVDPVTGPAPEASPVAPPLSVKEAVAESSPIPVAVSDPVSGKNLDPVSDPVSEKTSDPVSDPLPDPTSVKVLEAKLDGAQTAVRLHAERRRTLEGEVTFLKDRLVQAEQEGRELRLLIAQSVQAQQRTADELTYLRELAVPKPALPAPRKAKWWMPWRR